MPAVVGAILAPGPKKAVILIKTKNSNFFGRYRQSFYFSISVSLYGGSAFIEYYELSKYSHMAQGFVMLCLQVFGLLGIGILYQSIALMHGKPLSEVISEVKAAFISILSNGKGGKN